MRNSACPTRRAVLAAGSCLACVAVLRSAPVSAGSGGALPFGFRAWGSFRALAREGRIGAEVTLADALRAGLTEAVGAVADLAGEVTILGGRPLVSLGDCPACAPAADPATGAALLAGARVGAWHEPVAAGEDLDEAGWRAFVGAEARRAGLDLAAPFPFRLEGELRRVVMHVNRGPLAPAPHGTAAPGGAGHGGGGHALQAVTEAARLPALVVGLYAGEGRDGLVSHVGDPYHCHWVDPARTRTAHLDRFGAARGMRLLLPRS